MQRSEDENSLPFRNLQNYEKCFLLPTTSLNQNGKIEFGKFLLRKGRNCCTNVLQFLTKINMAFEDLRDRASESPKVNFMGRELPEEAILGDPTEETDVVIENAALVDELKSILANPEAQGGLFRGYDRAQVYTGIQRTVIGVIRDLETVLNELVGGETKEDGPQIYKADAVVLKGEKGITVCVYFHLSSGQKRIDRTIQLSPEGGCVVVSPWRIQEGKDAPSGPVDSEKKHFLDQTFTLDHIFELAQTERD